MTADNIIHPEERLWWSFANPCTDEQGDIDVECLSDRMLDRIAALEAENADLQEQNTALRTVVAAWAKENNVGSLTLRDALDAVDILNIARRVAAEAGVQFDQNGVPT